MRKTEISGTKRPWELLELFSQVCHKTGYTGINTQNHRRKSREDLNQILLLFNVLSL